MNTDRNPDIYRCHICGAEFTLEDFGRSSDLTTSPGAFEVYHRPDGGKVSMVCDPQMIEEESNGDV